MRTLILTSIFTACLVNLASAQSFHAGLKIGSNVNKITGMSFKDEFTYNYHAGAFATIGLGKKISIQPEVLFNQVSADTTNQFSELYKLNFDKVKNVKLNYLSIPILVNVNLSKFFALQVGPQYGILMNGGDNLVANGKNAFKNGDFSLLGGVQIKVASLRIYGRYGVGLNNINDIDNKDRWKNQTIQLGIGLALL